MHSLGHAVAQRLRHCATNRKVAGSISDGLIEIFFYIILPGALWLWGRPSLLTEMRTRNISWGKGGRCVGLTTCHLHVPIVLKFGSLNLLETSGPVKGCNSFALPLPYSLINPKWRVINNQDHILPLLQNGFYFPKNISTSGM
jgi:hypothetical protein